MLNIHDLHVAFVYVVVKDDLQSLLRSRGTLVSISIISSHLMECESMLFVMNHLPYL